MIAVSFALLCLVLAVGASPHLLVAVAMLAGFGQAVSLTWTQERSIQFCDDIALAVLVGYALVSPGRVPGHPRRWFLLAAALTALALARSPDLGVGLAQARQVLLPVGLIFAGYVLRDRLQWRPLLRLALFLAFGVVAWMITEELLQRPVVDPYYYYVDIIGADPLTLRSLPGYGPISGAYIADVPGGTIFRPGGPFLNPPAAGFFLGLGSYAAMRLLTGPARVAALLLIAGGLAMAYARAGMLIFAATVVMSWLWRRAGRGPTIAVGVMAAAFVASIFLTQGNTASHSDGLISGFMRGATTIIGGGFGSTGYQAALAEGGANDGAGTESLLGLYFAWLGVPAILVALVTLIRLWRNLRASDRADSVSIWLAVGFVATVATSETASSMAATPLLWLLLGAALRGATPSVAGGSRGRSSAQIDSRHERRGLAGSGVEAAA